jgi:NAD(P)-dependent dehydrogenase (short-subunit alcohol dehydrogenase family)
MTWTARRTREIDPGKVFDLELPGKQAAATYQAMSSGAIKILPRPRPTTVRRAMKGTEMSATNETGRFAGKVAFVTGAGSGMGRTTAALAFAREGASVVLADVSDSSNQDTARMIEEFGGRALAVGCDVTQSEHVQAALNQAVGVFGRLDVAFNNAGAEQKPSVTVDVTEEEWDRIIAINLRGVFLCMKYEIPMLQHGGGAIVNNSSGAGIKAFGRGAAYAAAKHGVVGLTKDAALDYASSNIRINAVCPGIVDTEMMQRFTGGTTEGRDRVIAQENPSDGWEHRTRSPAPSCGCVLTQPPSSSATPWSSTAAKRSENAQQPRPRFKNGPPIPTDPSHHRALSCRRRPSAIGAVAAVPVWSIGSALG